MFPRLPISGNIVAETKFVKMFAKKLTNILVAHGLFLYASYLFHISSQNEKRYFFDWANAKQSFNAFTKV